MDLVPVARLTSHGELFRCEPYASVITARACLARQQAARRPPRIGEPASPVRHSRCVACALGARVAERLSSTRDAGAPPDVPTCVAERLSSTRDAGAPPDVPTCSAPGCSRPVVGARGRAPLCREHRARSDTATTTQETTTMTTEKPDDTDDNATELCLAKGCSRARGRVRKDTQQELTILCAPHRLRAHTLVRARRAATLDDAVKVLLGAAPAEVPQAERAPAKKPAAKKLTAPARPAKAPRIGDGLALVRRLAAVVGRLGGIDAAEALATELETIGGGA